MNLFSPLGFDVQRKPERKAFLNTENGGVLKNTDMPMNGGVLKHQPHLRTEAF
jgi:hypothetical protein